MNYRTIEDTRNIRSRSVKPILMLQQLRLPALHNQHHSSSSTPNKMASSPSKISLMKEYSSFKARMTPIQDQTEIAIRIKQFKENRWMPNGSSKNRKLDRIRLKRTMRMPRTYEEIVRGQSKTIDVVNHIESTPWEFMARRMPIERELFSAYGDIDLKNL